MFQDCYNNKIKEFNKELNTKLKKKNDEIIVLQNQILRSNLVIIFIILYFAFLFTIELFKY